MCFILMSLIKKPRSKNMCLFFEKWIPLENEDMTPSIPFLHSVATGVSLSWLQHPVVLHMADPAGRVLKGSWWIHRLVDSPGTMTRAGIRDFLGLEKYRLPLFDFPSLMASQWNKNVAGYSQRMKPYDMLKSQIQLQSGQMNNVRQRRSACEIHIKSRIKKSGQGNAELFNSIHPLNESCKSC